MTWALLVFGVVEQANALPATNQPPTMSFLWPARRPFLYPADFYFFGYTTEFKLKVEAFDPDGSIAEVRFFSGMDLIGTATNPPYAVTWIVPLGRREIRAVAVDNSGNETVARAGLVTGLAGRPPFSYVDIIRPAIGSMFAAPATFEFAAELFASGGENGNIEFLVDGSAVGQVLGGGLMNATTPPAVVQVTNLVEGNHILGIRYDGTDCFDCRFVTNHIRVVRLGVHSPRVPQDGIRQFEVATSYAFKRHVIEVSGDLLDWCQLGETNAPGTNAFTFVVPGPASPDHRYYRVVVPDP